MQRITGKLAGLAEHAAADAQRLVDAGRVLRMAQAKTEQLAARGKRDAVAGAGCVARSMTWLKLLDVTRRIAAQTRQRLAGTTPAGATRRVSLHEHDTRPIAKAHPSVTFSPRSWVKCRSVERNRPLGGVVPGVHACQVRTNLVLSRREREAANRLRTAQDTHVPCAPIRDLIGGSNVLGAYAVQSQLTSARLAAGATVVGRKIALTSLAVQDQLGVDQPDFGMLFDDMAYHDNATIAPGCLLQPKIEAEVAFVLGDDLIEGALTFEQVRGAIAYALAALEIVDSRVANWDISIADTIADNASSGLFVTGSRQLRLDEFEPADVEMTMTHNGEIVSVGRGDACLGNPLAAVQWLAAIARNFGEPLRRGQVILSGALGPMVPVFPGSVVRAEIGPLGTVTARFSGQAS